MPSVIMHKNLPIKSSKLTNLWVKKILQNRNQETIISPLNKSDFEKGEKAMSILDFNFLRLGSLFAEKMPKSMSTVKYDFFNTKVSF